MILRQRRYLPKPRVVAQPRTLGLRSHQPPYAESRYTTERLMCNTFGVSVERTSITQGAPLRVDPGLWNRTPLA